MSKSHSYSYIYKNNTQFENKIKSLIFEVIKERKIKHIEEEYIQENSRFRQPSAIFDEYFSDDVIKQMHESISELDWMRMNLIKMEFANFKKEVSKLFHDRVYFGVKGEIIFKQALEEAFDKVIIEYASEYEDMINKDDILIFLKDIEDISIQVKVCNEYDNEKIKTDIIEFNTELFNELDNEKSFETVHGNKFYAIMTESRTKVGEYFKYSRNFYLINKNKEVKCVFSFINAGLGCIKTEYAKQNIRDFLLS